MKGDPVDLVLPDRVALGTEGFRQFAFLGLGCLEGHGIVNLVQRRQEVEAVFLDVLVGLVAGLVVLETGFWIEPSHADIEAGEVGVVTGVGGDEFLVLQNRVIQLDNIDMVMGVLGHLAFAGGRWVGKKISRPASES